MQRSPTLLQDAPVGDLVCQGVLERVLTVGKQAGRVEKLSRLEMSQPLLDVGLAEIRDSRENWVGNVLSHDCRGLKQSLLFGWQTVEAGGQNRLDRRRHLHAF